MLTEKEVTINSDVSLKGSLTIPHQTGAQLPAILIIGGTGKIDRNGRVNKKLHLRLYEQLSEALTEMGFVTLRYDKRGVGESAGDYHRTGLWDLVTDAKACVQFLKKLSNVDPEKVYVLGHSEGCTIGTALAVREPVAGLLLLAGAVERLEDALVRQRELAAKDILEGKGFQASLLRLLGVPKKIEKQAQAFMKKVLSSTDDVMKVQFQSINAKWMREHFSYDVLDDLAKVTCPVLAITGEYDIQADPARLPKLTEYVHRDADYQIIAQMGHSMKYQEKPSTMFTIKKDLIREANLPLHPELVEKVRGWLEPRK